MNLTCSINDNSTYIWGKFKSPGVNLLLETKEIYESIFEVMGRKYPFLIKCHNSIPNILGISEGQPRYHSFNAGRLAAFEQKGYKLRPAAVGIGSPFEQLEINFLACNQQPVDIENPRQTSAFEYPKEFGPAPLFSRSVAVNGEVYISGTASIVGSQTVHEGNLEGQLRETVANLQVLCSLHGTTMDMMNYIVYVKHHHHVDRVKSLFLYKAQYVVCDICRDNLLIEIEATSKNGKQISPLYT